MARNIFNSVKGLHPRRNAFSALTFRNDFTAPLGVNIPCYVQHLPPATRIKVWCSALVRLQALFAPIMDNIDFYVHFWQMPLRLILSDQFTQFISGEIDPSEYEEQYVTPDDISHVVVDALNITDLPSDKLLQAYNDILGNGSLFDFLGYDFNLFPSASLDSDNKLTIGSKNNTTKFNIRPLLMYFKLLHNWYMNENVPYYEAGGNLSSSFLEDMNLITSIDDPYSAILTVVHFYLKYRHTLSPHAWEKDYFTSALPNVQNGSPVSLPIAGTAPVQVTGQNGDEFGYLTVNADGSLSHHGVDLVNNLGLVKQVYDPELQDYVYQLDNDTKVDNVMHHTSDKGDVVLTGVADLSEASAITINELRFANALQVFKERQMRFGRRRQEYYLGFFDVTPEDLRLMLPKYIGGGRIPINISDIEQTSQTTTGEGGSAQGNLSGKATAVAGGFAGFNTFCSEESIIMGICFAMPHISYANSVSKFLLQTNDIYDYFNPSFEHLGEQPIINIELFSGSSQPDKEFGYTPRYTEYRFHNNECHGAFKDTLSYWTLARIFESQPSLSPEFIYMQPSVFNRIFAVEDSAPMLVSMIFKTRAIMPISKYGTPMLLA